jgi:ketosteroid isomerase-like protein
MQLSPFAIMPISIFLLASLGASGTTPSVKDSIEQKLIQLKHEIGQAYVKRDVAALERLYADDYTVTNDQGEITNKTEEIGRLKSGGVTYESASYEDVKVRVYGNVGIVAGRGTVKGSNRNEPFHTQYYSTNVFVKEKGEWRAVAAHISGVKKL